ncbi:MAG TPA: hypothetical protein DEB06_09310 [Phycisphaerales bacterium]|nr:hypothetical protein [Phycisphaerales bacterium]
MTVRSGWIVDAARRALGRIEQDRRATRRAPVSGLWCDRGQVIDLSTRGMRLMSFRAWGEGQRRRVTVADGKHSAELIARCVWSRQEGLFTHHIGLAFEGVTDEEQRALVVLLRRQDEE